MKQLIKMQKRRKTKEGGMKRKKIEKKYARRQRGKEKF